MKKLLHIFILLLATQWLQAETLEDQARAKISALNSLIIQAESQGIPTLHEKTTVRTAEVFLDFANWDEANKDIVAHLFSQVTRYKNDSTQMAELLPDFERQDVIDMLEDASVRITKLINGEIRRLPSPNVDWSEANLDADQILYQDRPVFLQDYTWKPSTELLSEYHGQLDGFFLAPNHVEEDGSIKKWIADNMSTKESGTLGFIFLNHKSPPDWAKEKYGPNFEMRTNSYTHYDIDNPGAREMQGMLLSASVPYFKGNKYSELGYMLCNEPHFYTTKTGEKVDWASGGVSDYTFDKFRDTLAVRHHDIAALNSRWGSDFSAFDEVSISIPIANSLQGTAMWYDWVSFNRERVTEWFSDLKDTIQHYDPAAKTHIKIMPNLWSENKRGHGIDLEELTRLSEIIGNDASVEHETMYGGPYEFQEHFVYEWRELCMSYDFMKSVSPNKIILNSENHFLSTGRSRNLYQEPLHARSTFFLGHMWGLTANQIWFWPRKEDGSPKSEEEKGFAGSNIHQPWLTNEIHTTTLDLNTFSEDIMAMQRQAKPIRIFFSETSAINISTHMDDVFELYDKMVFDGVPIGFVTKGILDEQQYDDYKVVVAWKTPYVRDDEWEALQTYLNNGGTLITDGYSFLYNEYGENREPLTAGNGQIYKYYSTSAFKDKAFKLIADDLPALSINESNNQGRKTCLWKCIQNAQNETILTVVNVGKEAATLNVKLNNTTKGTVCIDRIDGVEVSTTPTLEPREVYFVKVVDSVSTSIAEFEGLDKAMEVYPNPSLGHFTLAFDNANSGREISVFALSGRQLMTQRAPRKKETLRLNYPSGTYLLKVDSGMGYEYQKIMIE